MLIEFSVTNYRSFKERQTLSLVKAEGGELADTNTFKPDGVTDIELLRTAALYGPNAGGKSSLLNAVYAMRWMVLRSATNGQRGGCLPVVPFLLDQATTNSPSEFEIILIAEGVRYQYGFSATKDRIVQEWLTAFPKGRPQHWFERSWDEPKREYQWDMGYSLTGNKQVWKESTRSNALFLSTAVQLNSKQLQPMYDWFRGLHVIHADRLMSLFTASQCDDDSGRSDVLNILQSADLDISEVSVDFENEHLEDNSEGPHGTDSKADDSQDDLTDVMQDMRGDDSGLWKIHTVHKTVQGTDVAFSMSEESDGTQRLFSLAGPMLDALKSGHVFMVDDLHGSFHPMMTKFILSLFHSDASNPKNAQLVFATHETSIMSKKTLRKDQVWFCEKNKDKASMLYSLSDFKAREGVENPEISYLSGRYGALPYTRKASLSQVLPQ